MKSDAPKLEAGARLGGRYRLVSLLGRGGMGEVWVALDETLGSEVAVKLLNDPGPSAFLDDARARFDAEQKVLAQLRSPYIVQIRDRGITHLGWPYFVMDRLEGKSLQEHLSERSRLTTFEVLELLEDLGRAIQEPHAKGLIHRDLKPGNIFLLEYTGQRRLEVRLLDFGIAKSITGPVSDSAETKPGMMLGTPLYIAPEQIEGRPTQASDIYALGIVAYRCLAGVPPFFGDQVAVLSQHLASPIPPFEPALGVPSEVEALIRSLLEKVPEFRPTAEELVTRVDQLKSHFVTLEHGVDGHSHFPVSSESPLLASTPPRALMTPNASSSSRNEAAALALPLTSSHPLVAEDTSSPSGTLAPVSSFRWRWVGLAFMIGVLVSLVVIINRLVQTSREAEVTTVELRIYSHPTGAQVQLDEADLGQTPVIARLKPSKELRKLGLKLKGYEKLERKVLIFQDMYLDLALKELPKVRAELKVPSEKPAPAKPLTSPSPRRKPEDSLAAKPKPARPKPSQRKRRPARVTEKPPHEEPKPSQEKPQLVRVVFRSGQRGPAVKLRIGSRLYGGTPIRVDLPAGQTVQVEHLGQDGVWRKTPVRVPVKSGAVLPLD